MIFFDVTKTSASAHNSGLTRVTRRLLAELQADANARANVLPVVWKKRGWFGKALKFGIAIGSDADKKMLIDFTGNPEYVYDSDQFANKSLADIIKIIVQQSSVVSVTSSSDDDDAQDNAALVITDTLNGVPGLGEEQP